MRPPKIDFRFLIYTPKKHIFKKNMVLKEKITNSLIPNFRHEWHVKIKSLKFTVIHLKTSNK